MSQANSEPSCAVAHPDDPVVLTAEMAKAIRDHDPYCLSVEEKAAMTALAEGRTVCVPAAPPPGWKLVPVEPGHQMLLNMAMLAFGNTSEAHVEDMRQVYRCVVFKHATERHPTDIQSLASPAQGAAPAPARSGASSVSGQAERSHLASDVGGES